MGGKLSNQNRKGHFEEEIEATVLSLQKKLNRNLGKLVTVLQKLDNFTTAKEQEDRDVHQKWRMSWGSLIDIFPLRPEPPHEIELQDFSDRPERRHKIELVDFCVHPEPPILPALREEPQPVEPQPSVHPPTLLPGVPQSAELQPPIQSSTLHALPGALQPAEPLLAIQLLAEQLNKVTELYADISRLVATATLPLSDDGSQKGVAVVSPPPGDNHQGMHDKMKTPPQQLDPPHRIVTRSQVTHQTFPLISYPNPHPRPPPDAEQEVQDAYSETIQVQRNWTLDELNEIVKELPDPTEDAGRWCTSVLDLIEMYQPSARELESVFRRFFKLKWPHLKGDFDTSGPRNDIVAGQLQNPGGLFSRVRQAYPVHTDWQQIYCIKQNHDESCDVYRARMEQSFNRHSGLTRDNVAYDSLLKSSLVNGLLPAIKTRIMMSCIGWETLDLAHVWEHAKHAERYAITQEDTRKKEEEERKKKLEAAQLMYYEQRAKTLEMEPPQQHQQEMERPQQHQLQKHGRQGGCRVHKRQKQDQDQERRRLKLCYCCGSGEHIRNNCPQKQLKKNHMGNHMGGKRQHFCCFPF